MLELPELDFVVTVNLQYQSELKTNAVSNLTISMIGDRKQVSQISLVLVFGSSPSINNLEFRPQTANPINESTQNSI